MTNRKLLDQIRRYAESRSDLLCSDSPYDGSELMLLQIRRVIRFQVINEGGFTPHEKKFWHYYALPFLIDTRIGDKLTKKQQDNRGFAKMMGMEWIGAATMADVEKALGVQEAWTRDSARPEKV